MESNHLLDESARRCNYLAFKLVRISSFEEESNAKKTNITVMDVDEVRDINNHCCVSRFVLTLTNCFIVISQQHLSVPSNNADGSASFQIKSVIVHLDSPLHYIVVSRCNNHNDRYYIQEDFERQPLMGPYSWAEVRPLVSGESTRGRSSGVFALYSRTGFTDDKSSNQEEFHRATIHRKATELIPHALQDMVKPYQSDQKQLTQQSKISIS